MRQRLYMHLAFLLALALIFTLGTSVQAAKKRNQPTTSPTTTATPTPTPTSTPTPSPTPTATPTSANPKLILGYYTVYYAGDSTSYNALNTYSSYMNAISTITFNITAAGAITGEVPSSGLTLASSRGVQAYAAISNSESTGFNPDTVKTLLASSTARQTAVANIVNLVEANGYKGVNLDFENLYAADRAAYSSFVKQVGDALHTKGFRLIVSVTAKTADNPTWAWSGALDYAALGAAADYLQLMTYDDHGPWSAPGAVAGYDWVNKVLQYAVSQVPASKLILGLPAYGYDWNVSAGTGHKAVAWKNTANLISSTGAVSQWDTVTQSPYFSYTLNGQNHVVWYENTASITAKTKLAGIYGLAGVSEWRMGLENESFWQAVRSGLAQ